VRQRQGVGEDYVEGGNHTTVQFGDRRTSIPRHNEIDEYTARGILRYLGGEDQ